MIRLTQFSASPLCAEIRRALRFKGVEFELFEWPIAEFGALGLQAQSAGGGLPILQFDGTEKFRETAVIALEIESRFQQPPLLPDDPAERGHALVLENWATNGLYFLGLAVRFLPDDVEASVKRILVTAGDVYDTARELLTQRMEGMLLAHGLGTQPREWLVAYLQRILGGVEEMQRATGFVVGPKITLADLAIVSQIAEIRETSVGSEILRSRPALVEYLDRVDALAPA